MKPKTEATNFGSITIDGHQFEHDQGADDAVGNRLSQAEGVADGDHEVADTQAVGFGQGQGS